MRIEKNVIAHKYPFVLATIESIDIQPPVFMYMWFVTFRGAGDMVIKFSGVYGGGRSQVKSSAPEKQNKQQQQIPVTITKASDSQRKPYNHAICPPYATVSTKRKFDPCLNIQFLFLYLLQCMHRGILTTHNYRSNKVSQFLKYPCFQMESSAIPECRSPCYKRKYFPIFPTSQKRGEA